jgi:bacillithiol system protein YtxJ
MNWTKISEPAQLDELKKESETVPVLIFKHSTRCSISRATLDRLERHWPESDTAIKPYFLDLLTYREISNQIADQFAVEHESPQVLLIDKGAVIYTESHYGIDYQKIKQAVTR